LIRTAYQYGPADLDFLQLAGRGRGMNFNNVYGLGVEDGVRVRGGADWVRSERYTIDAVADGAVDAETMRGPMLKALLERPFQLEGARRNRATAGMVAEHREQRPQDQADGGERM
jgi:hypothetical protein